MWKEFRDFIMRGNVIDLAVGIIIGAAFTTIVNSLVADILMPPIGQVLGNVDFSNLFIVLGEGEYASLEAARAAGAATINYGLFITNVINFLIVAFVVFMVVRSFNQMMRRFQKQEEPAAPEEVAPVPEALMLEELRAIRTALERRPPTT